MKCFSTFQSKFKTTFFLDTSHWGGFISLFLLFIYFLKFFAFHLNLNLMFLDLKNHSKMKPA